MNWVTFNPKIQCVVQAVATGLFLIGPTFAQTDDPSSDKRVRPLLDMILPAYDARRSMSATPSSEDEIAIKSAATRLHLALDTRQFDAMGEMFTTDGVLDYQFGYAEGRESIRRMFRTHRADASGARHHAMNELVTVNPDGTATLVGYLLVLLVADPRTGAPAGPTPIASGVETFTFRKIEGHWLIARMTQEETVLSSTIATPEQIRFNALTATARAGERRKAKQ